MRFGIWYTLPSENFKAAVKRFLETGGMPPEGVKLESRWHAATAGKGFILASSNDPKAVYQWTASWADVIHFDVSPVLDDNDAQGVLKSLKS